MKKNSRGVALVVAPTAAMVLALAGCGSESAGSQDSGKASAGPSLRVVPEASRSAKALSAGNVSVRTDAKLKTVVVDGKGMTTYVFTKDAATPGESSCYDACATAWPPVPAADSSAAAGLNRDLLGSLTRKDGTEQLTVAGKPLYYFAQDEKAGDTKGQGVNKVWYAAAPDGAPAGVDRPALGVLDDPALGRVLQDREGRTLYLLTKDTPWPMKTACDAACLENWTPSAPVTAADARAAGLDPKVLFTFTTPDGTPQESFNCWPAYTFKGDTGPGQTNGQKVGGVWFAVKADIPASDRGKTVPAAKG
ncbi:SCO0930 family lipoprotein [Streptomyces sp. NPDC002018]|uniref:SCO0930 family lipoprotein n=1 Tax=Streptomyces sp. NPDC002018 TaxID=3364629 RepID=UPI003692EF84